MPRGAACGAGSRGCRRRGQGPYPNTCRGGRRHLAASPDAACSPADRHVSDLSMEEFLRLVRNVVREEWSEIPILSQVDTHEASGSSSQGVAAPSSRKTSATSSSTAIPLLLPPGPTPVLALMSVPSSRPPTGIPGNPCPMCALLCVYGGLFRAYTYSITNVCALLPISANGLE